MIENGSQNQSSQGERRSRGISWTVLAIMIVGAVIAVIVFGCQEKTVTPTVVRTEKPFVTATAPMPGTPIPSTPVIEVVTVVVTSQPMEDLGVLLEVEDQPMTPKPGNLIDWDHLKLMDEWVEGKGLTDAQVLYVQSGTPNEITLVDILGEDGKVPEGTALIFGAYEGTVEVNGESYHYGDGFYGVLIEGTEVSLKLRNGFALLISSENAQPEYCARIAQAINEGWAYTHIFRPSTWTEPVCEGVITTPLDNDR